MEVKSRIQPLQIPQHPVTQIARASPMPESAMQVSKWCANVLIDSLNETSHDYSCTGIYIVENSR